MYQMLFNASGFNELRVVPTEMPTRGGRMGMTNLRDCLARLAADEAERTRYTSGH